VKVLILGGDGMLGHRLVQVFSPSHDVVTTVRKPSTGVVSSALAGSQIIAGVDVREAETWLAVLRDERPQVVVNAVGIVKQRPAAADSVESILVNSLFPQRLAEACRRTATRLIHYSTDCVFSGHRGDYRETDIPDPVDLYGRTKLVGEVGAPGCLTIRTSIIGLELANRTGLVEWFLGQSGEVRGYRKAIWSGFTTQELARLTCRLIEHDPDIEGVWHVSSRAISKYELLVILNELLDSATAVVADESVVIDRSLNSEKFQAATGYQPPNHETMLGELAADIRQRKERDVA
jgi:dTDP-4-dehydrorhamnose reductase